MGEEMSRQRSEVFVGIVRERDYQDRKWGINPHSVGEWLLIVEAELAEAKQAWVKGHGPFDALREMLQVIAVGVACLEEHGVYERVSDEEVTCG